MKPPTYTIVPAAEPSRSFTLTLESSDTDSVTVSPPTMSPSPVGTNGNWETEQTATVIGEQDGDEFDDVATIRHRSTYSGEEYFLDSGVEVTVADGNRAPFFEEGLKITRTIDENSSQGAGVGRPGSCHRPEQRYPDLHAGYYKRAVPTRSTAVARLRWEQG